MQVAQKHLNTKIKNKTVSILSILRQIVIHSSYFLKRFMVDIRKVDFVAFVMNNFSSTIRYDF